MSAWTTLRTWVTGETVTAAEMNAQIRDNLTAIALTRCRVIGTAGGTLTASTAGQHIGRSGVEFDPLNMIGGFASFMGCVVPIAGTYRVSGRLGGSSSNSCTLALYKNAALQYVGPAQSSLPPNFALLLPENDVALAAGDTIEMRANTGASVFTLATGYLANLTADFAVEWICP